MGAPASAHRPDSERRPDRWTPILYDALRRGRVADVAAGAVGIGEVPKNCATGHDKNHDGHNRYSFASTKQESLALPFAKPGRRSWDSSQVQRQNCLAVVRYSTGRKPTLSGNLGLRQLSLGLDGDDPPVVRRMQ